MLATSRIIIRDTLSKAANLGGCGTNYAQVRYAKKTFKFRFKYGQAPLFQDYMIEEAKEANTLDNLKFTDIRMAAITETPSPLFDRDVLRFERIVLMGGRYGLAADLVHKTFYEIKCIQRAKFMKREQMKDKGDKKSANQSPDDDTEIELNPLVIFKRALKNCEPILVTKKVRRGGAIYQVPFPVIRSQSEWLAIHWLRKAIRERPKPRKQSFEVCLARELLEAYRGQGKVVRQKEDIHRLAHANRAFAHYRWG